MKRSDWLTYPERDGFYWLLNGNTGADAEVIAVHTDDKGRRWVSYMGLSGDDDDLLDRVTVVDVWFLPVPKPKKGPWKTED